MKNAPTTPASLFVLVSFVLVMVMAGTIGCGVPQPLLGVSVDAREFDVRIDHASGIELAGLALVLQCSASEGLIEGRSFTKSVDVPLTIESRREGDVDIHHVRFEGAQLRNPFNELGQMRQECHATMTLHCADESGETRTVLQYFRGAGSSLRWDVTDEVLDGIAGTLWRVRTVVRDAPSKGEHPCALVTSVTRDGETIDLGTGTPIRSWQDQRRCEAARAEALRR